MSPAITAHLPGGSPEHEARALSPVRHWPSPGGRVSIAAARDARDHADRFWSLALAIRAGKRAGRPFVYQMTERESVGALL